jgi:hypothetical protein
MAPTEGYTVSDHPDGLDLDELMRDLRTYTEFYPDFPDQFSARDCGVRGRLLMAIPPLLARLERVTKERDRYREQCALEHAVEHITQAIADPGSVLPREGRDTDRPESVPRWSARAVLHALQTRRKRDHA